MKILKKIVLVLVLLLAVLAVVIATRSAEMHVERTAVVNAPPEAVYAVINDLHQWGRWSPYDKRDPNMTKTYEGAAMGPGASYSWSGNNDVGAGRMTIVESKPGQLVTMKLEFTRPFSGTNTVNFKLVPAEGGTRVSWIMDGQKNFISKGMSMVMDMDKMIGGDFEVGLANLDAAMKKGK